MCAPYVGAGGVGGMCLLWEELYHVGEELFVLETSCLWWLLGLIDCKERFGQFGTSEPNTWLVKALHYILELHLLGAVGWLLCFLFLRDARWRLCSVLDSSTSGALKYWSHDAPSPPTSISIAIEHRHPRSTICLKNPRDAIPVSQLADIKQKVADILKVESHLLYLASVRQSCIVMTFLVSASLVGWAFPLSPSQKESLALCQSEVAEV